MIKKAILASHDKILKIVHKNHLIKVQKAPAIKGQGLFLFEIIYSEFCNSRAIIKYHIAITQHVHSKNNINIIIKL